MAFTSNPDINEILSIPNHVYWNPANPAGGEANWGIQLGFSESGAAFEPRYEVFPHRREETGEAIIKLIYVGSPARVMIVSRNWNSAAVTAMFPGLGSGPPTKIRSNGAIIPGTDLSSGTYSKPLLIVPQDSDNSICLLIQKACPHPINMAKLHFSHKKRLTFPIVFDALWKNASASGQYYIGPLTGAALA